MPQSSFKSGSWWVICKDCQIEKEVSEFYINQSNQKPRTDCKVCYNLKHKKPTKEKRQEYTTKYRESNPELSLERTRTWRKNNLEYDAFRAANRRALKLQQTPPWANMDKIKTIYLNCPEGYHVDHIIPLKGEAVRGFHVETNLQYLPAKENLAKRNRYAN